MRLLGAPPLALLVMECQDEGDTAGKGEGRGRTGERAVLHPHTPQKGAGKATTSVCDVCVGVCMVMHTY